MLQTAVSSGTGTVANVVLQSDGAAGAVGGILFLLAFLFAIAVAVASIAGMWKAFEKADQPGWGALIPILNFFYLLEIADKPTWWLILLFVPVVNIFVPIVVMLDVAKNFGKGPGYGLGLYLLSPVFWPLLGFGDAEYVGDTSAGV